MPAGTGKTSTARVLAGRASLPLVYVPLESLVSKWYGESEQNMAKVGLAAVIAWLVLQNSGPKVPAHAASSDRHAQPALLFHAAAVKGGVQGRLKQVVCTHLTSNHESSR